MSTSPVTFPRLSECIVANALGYVRAATEDEAHARAAALAKWVRKQRHDLELLAVYHDTETPLRRRLAAHVSMDGVTGLLDDLARAEVVVVFSRAELAAPTWRFDACEVIEVMEQREIVVVGEEPPPPPAPLPPAPAPPPGLEVKERAELTVRLLNGRVRSVERGYKGSGPVPYGYKRGPEDNGFATIVPEPAEAALVQRIFREYNRRYASLGKLVAMLNAEGHRTRRGAKWSRAGVSWVLRSPIYIGSVRFGDVQGRGRHVGIVAPIMYAKAQKKLREQRRAGGPGSRAAEEANDGADGT